MARLCAVLNFFTKGPEISERDEVSNTGLSSGCMSENSRKMFPFFDSSFSVVADRGFHSV